MTGTTPFDGFDGLQRIAEQLRETLSATNLSNFSHLMEDIRKAPDVQMKLPSTIINNAVLRDMKSITALEQLASGCDATRSALQLHWDTLAQIATAVETPEIQKLKTGLLNYDYSALQTFSQSLNAVRIEAPNLALLKNARVFSQIDLPKGIPTVIKGLHSDTARRLTTAEDISFDTTTKRFYVESAPENTATVSEMNVVCSSMELLAGIDETDLISFLNVLDDEPYFASESKVGRQIIEIINDWDTFIDFDKPEFYHARTLKDGVCPYTNADLLKAPHGVTGHGRFNGVGQNHYYFSDASKGAIMEVKKHTSEKRIQIARLRPITHVRMLDLSEEITSRNTFLELCRCSIPTDSHNTIHREYLLPCYVAACCKRARIDGIKYYGSKEYKNYVTWADSHFSVIDSTIETIN